MGRSGGPGRPSEARTGQAMRCKLTLATIMGLALGAHGAVADQASLADFYGQWRGVTAESSGLQDVEPGDLSVTVRPDDAGFRMRWTAFGSATDEPAERRVIEVGFEPTGQPGVFAYREEPGSLFGRLFASPETTNPLEGETLLWARLEGPSLTVYSLALDRRGGFRLDRYERTLDNGALSLLGTRRTGRGRVVTIEGRLEKE